MAKRRAIAEPVMTNSAALRVLYDLAGGRAKTWQALGRELDINVDDIYKRNRPWPSDFGRIRYRDAFNKYAEEVHTSRYATVLAVKRSLQNSNAYTAEVKAIVENVRADSDDKLVQGSLERLLDTIIETALPYNELPPLADGPAVGAPASMRAARCGGDAGRMRRPCGDAVPAAPAPCGGLSVGTSAGGPFASAAPPDGALTPRLLAACLAGTEVRGVFWTVAAGRLCGGAAPPAPPACARRRVAAGVALDAERFLGAVLCPSLMQLLACADAFDRAMDGLLDAPSLDLLAASLCDDEGLGCRTMAARCASLMERADAGAFSGDADYLLACLETAGRSAGDSLGVADLAAVRRLYLVCADRAPSRGLFVLVLVALLGVRRARVVMECPATRYLFAR